MGVRRKKIRGLLFAVSLMAAMAGCGSQTEIQREEKQSEITVFAAASMTETLTEIGKLYEEAHRGIRIVFNFDSSGTLKTQIQEGADCDLFISAAQKQMDELEKEDALILAGTRKNILENKVTLCVAEEKRAEISTFDQWAEKLGDGAVFMAMGNSDVPVGQYTQKILAYYGLDEERLKEQGLISYGSNVKEVTTQILEGSVDCGIIYCTDAISAGLSIQDYATEEMCGKVVYPAGVLKNSAHPEEAKAFLEFLQTDECMKIFEKVGFSAVSESSGKEI